MSNCIMAFGAMYFTLRFFINNIALVVLLYSTGLTTWEEASCWRNGTRWGSDPTVAGTEYDNHNHFHCTFSLSKKKVRNKD